MNGKIKRASELFSNNKNAKMAEQANITRASFMRMTSELSKPIALTNAMTSERDAAIQKMQSSAQSLEIKTGPG